MIDLTYRKLAAISATVLPVDVSVRRGWKVFSSIARASRFTAGQVIADLSHERRMQYWYALSCMDAVDWLAIRATLRTSDSALCRKHAFQNTRAY